MTLKLVADGLQFPEGPVAMADGSVVLVEMRRGTLTALLPTERPQHCRRTWPRAERRRHRPRWRGLRLQQRLRLDLAGRRTEHAGRPTARLSRWLHSAGRSCHRPIHDALRQLRRQASECSNDLVFDSQGGFWFTCLGQGDGEVRRMGALYYGKSRWLENHPLAQRPVLAKRRRPRAR